MLVPVSVPVVRGSLCVWLVCLKVVLSVLAFRLSTLDAVGRGWRAKGSCPQRPTAGVVIAELSLRIILIGRSFAPDRGA